MNPLSFANSEDWGFYGHRKINEIAIYTLPAEMFGFYKENQYFLREHAVDPDKRRYSMKGEAERHYIDIDHYCKHEDESCDPFDIVPKHWNDAVEKFGKDTLAAYGIVPWHINKMIYQLTEAFKDKNKKRILRLSAELGHYIGDAHVPLHTTENYNGQQTNQIGIHGFWESRLPELFDGNYNFFTGKGNYLDDPLETIWDAVAESHHALDSVLRFEKELSEEWPSDKKYAYEERGVSLMRVFSQEYSDEYHRRLNGQVERRMKQAIVCLGSYWYTAWVNAGQPDLTSIQDISLELIEAEILEEQKAPEKEELKKREHGN